MMMTFHALKMELLSRWQAIYEFSAHKSGSFAVGSGTGSFKGTIEFFRDEQGTFTHRDSWEFQLHGSPSKSTLIDFCDGTVSIAEVRYGSQIYVYKQDTQKLGVRRVPSIPHAGFLRCLEEKASLIRVLPDRIGDGEDDWIIEVTLREPLNFLLTTGVPLVVACEVYHLSRELGIIVREEYLAEDRRVIFESSYESPVVSSEVSDNKQVYIVPEGAILRDM